MSDTIGKVDPARAGMILLQPRASPPLPSRPRASGDDPPPQRNTEKAYESTPRERG